MSGGNPAFIREMLEGGKGFLMVVSCLLSGVVVGLASWNILEVFGSKV